MIKGVGLFNTHKNKVVIPKGVEFVVAWMESKFHQHVQEAWDADIPCLAIMQIDPSVYINDFSMTLGDKFPSLDRDPHVKKADSFLFIKDTQTKYGFNGIILDMQVENNRISGNWWAETAKHLSSVFSERYGVPVFLLTNDKMLKIFKEDNPQVFLSSYKNLATFERCAKFTDTNEVLLEPVGSPSPNWGNLKLWWYGAISPDFIEDSGNPYCVGFQFRGTRTEFYTLLGYKSHAVSTTSPSTGTVYSSDIMIILARIEAALDLLLKQE